jgi:RNA-binding protein PNO1
MEVDTIFPKLNENTKTVPFEFRKIPVPPHRMTPLRDHWDEIVAPIVEHMKLQIRMNTRLKRVEIRVSCI